jgi:hypothetical protein
MHERGVDLKIEADSVSALPRPNGGAPARQQHEPATKASPWREMLDMLRLKDPHRRKRSEED